MRTRGLLLPLAVFLGAVCGCAQSGQAPVQALDSLETTGQVPPPLPTQQTQAPAPSTPSMPQSSQQQSIDDSTRFLKSIPPAPKQQLPFPSIATPPIEDNPTIPLLTEAQQKKMEEDLEKLAKGQGEPRKKTAKKKKDEPAAKKPATPPAN